MRPAAAADPREHWREAAQRRLSEIVHAQADARSQHDALHARLNRELAELDSEVEHGPDRSSARPADRSGRPGMPLWRAVEFSPELDPTAQAGLEAALEGAGLLDR